MPAPRTPSTHPPRRAWLARLALAAGLLAALAGPGPRAQTTSARLSGTVRTADGLPARGAVVEARATATGAVRQARADERGRYLLGELPPGEWTVAARRGDGELSRSHTLTLGLQEAALLDLVLTGGLTEEVSVQASPPLLDPGRTGEELRIGRDEVASLPIAGRSVTDLALLDASVLAPQPGNFYGERDAVFLVNGQSGRANSFLVDGLDNNDLTSGTTLNAFLSQQVIREFVVMTSQFSPEFGRAGGGVLNIITERGTNEPSFEFFVQGAGDRANEPGRFVSNLPRPDGGPDVDRRLQAGFSYGGPLRRDRAFLFVAFEHQEIDAITPYFGTGRDGLPGGVVRSPRRDDNLFLRTDFNLGASSFLMVRLSADDRTTPDLNVGGFTTPEGGFLVEEEDVQLAASLTSVLPAGVIHEARLLVGTSSFDQLANSSRPGVSRPQGDFGGNQLNRQLRDEDRLQLVDNVTWQAGNHTLKAGLDIMRSRTRIDARFNPNGNFLYETNLAFEPGDCGDLVANDVRTALEEERMTNPDATIDDIKFKPLRCDGNTGVDDDGDGVIDEPGIIGTYPFAYVLIDGVPGAKLDDTDLGLFIQDGWQATPRLRLDYGLRYDLSTFTLPATAAVPSSIPNGGAGRDTDNLAPRLGFSYSPVPGGPWVVRGGAGIFHDKIVLGFPAVASITGGTQIGFIFPQGFTFEFTEREVEELGIENIKDALLFFPELTLRFTTGTELETPYTVQYSLGAERALGQRGALRFGATRALGYHQVLLKDLNPPEVNPDTGVPIHVNDPTIGSLAAFVTEGRSWYSGLDLGWRWRGEQARAAASYTLSRAEDLGFDPLRGGIALPPDSTRIAGERARTDADRRHRLVLHGETGLPWLGLRAAGILSLASAAPFNVTTGLDDNLDGVLSDRPDGLGRNTGAGTDLEVVNALRERLNAQRGLDLPPVTSLNAPSFAQLDLRLWKPLPLGGGGRGEIFVQVFNVLDRVNGGPVDGRVISPSFGQPVGIIGPPRTFEIGLKLGF